ncbi:pirin [Bordetella genomosp. 8]|uniref:Pirin n=1 Tax=Bordetella genomosp. 8 TaxID=1416806 RepID=A0A1W6YG54_9BORD|nr:pirin-like C-terminal cupin domain-containing protein [Bordetella genomosp. 8]ARP80057.1 pirin [Bordetella genomosp. 8]
MRDTSTTSTTGMASERLGAVVRGMPHRIGTGFSAYHFSEEMFGGRMDPLLMVDHFVMTAPTFEPHLHAGLSAVTALFEDSRGSFLNRDTLGRNIALGGGDLYWLAAASGAVHEERPADGARVHALQIFVNLPARLKAAPPRALHVQARSVPVLQGPGHRVRVVLGRSGDAAGADGTPEEMTLLDGFLSPGGGYTHTLLEGRQAWVYAVSGAVAVHCHGETRMLDAGSATTVAAGALADVTVASREAAHFVLLAGVPIRERFYKYGPLVMSSAAEVRRTLERYAEGGYGQIPADVPAEMSAGVPAETRAKTTATSTATSAATAESEG